MDKLFTFLKGNSFSLIISLGAIFFFYFHLIVFLDLQKIKFHLVLL